MRLPFLKRREEPTVETQGWSSLFQSEDQILVEQFKTFSARFEYRADVLGCKVVAVTSAVAGEGKTVSAVKLAMNLALTGRKRVLLVDVDMRKSDLAKGLQLPPVPGLSEFLSGSAKITDIARNSLVPGLVVIPAGMRIAAPWELITGERFRAFLEKFRKHCGLIILDTPPMIPVSDTMALRDLVDGFVLVYRLGFTPHPMLRQALEDIGEKKLLGVLLNGAAPQSERYYQRYYGKYYTTREAE